MSADIYDDWDGLPDHLASAITFYMVNHRPALCAAGTSEEKLNQYLVFSERRASVIKSYLRISGFEKPVGKSKLGKMFVFLGLSFPSETCQPVKPNTCHWGGQ